MKIHLMFVHAICGCDTVSATYYMKCKNIALEMLSSYGDQDSLSTLIEPRSPPEDMTNVGVRFLQKLYGAFRSTSLDKLRYTLYTRSVSRSSLSSGFKLESLPPTSAAAKFPFIPCLYCSATIIGSARQRWGDGVSLTTHSDGQLGLWWTANNGPPPMLPATWWPLLPGRPRHHRREGNGMSSEVATHCVKDTREEKCNNGLGTICAQLTGVGNTGTRV